MESQLLECLVAPPDTVNSPIHRGAVTLTKDSYCSSSNSIYPESPQSMVAAESSERENSLWIFHLVLCSWETCHTCPDWCHRSPQPDHYPRQTAQISLNTYKLCLVCVISIDGLTAIITQFFLISFSKQFQFGDALLLSLCIT